MKCEYLILLLICFHCYHTILINKPSHSARDIPYLLKNRLIAFTDHKSLFYNTNASLLMPCPDNNCDVCSRSDKDICRICKTGYYLYNSTCIEYCPQNTYADNLRAKCMPDNMIRYSNIFYSIAYSVGSCKNMCGKIVQDCSCAPSCKQRGNCCSDYDTVNCDYMFQKNALIESQKCHNSGCELCETMETESSSKMRIPKTVGQKKMMPSKPIKFKYILAKGFIGTVDNVTENHTDNSVLTNSTVNITMLNPNYNMSNSTSISSNEKIQINETSWNSSLFVNTTTSSIAHKSDEKNTTNTVSQESVSKEKIQANETVRSVSNDTLNSTKSSMSSNLNLTLSGNVTEKRNTNITYNNVTEKRDLIKEQNQTYNSSKAAFPSNDSSIMLNKFPDNPQRNKTGNATSNDSPKSESQNHGDTIPIKMNSNQTNTTTQSNVIMANTIESNKTSNTLLPDLNSLLDSNNSKANSTSYAQSNDIKKEISPVSPSHQDQVPYPDPGESHKKPPPTEIILIPLSTQSPNSSTNFKCNQCLSSYYLFNGKCHDKCPEGYIKNQVNHVCKPVGCSNVIENCEKCISVEIPLGKNNTTSTLGCIKCERGSFLINHKCVNSCPDGYRADRVTWSCLNSSEFAWYWVYPSKISCKDKCQSNGDSECSCNISCLREGNCCSDYDAYCSEVPDSRIKKKKI